MREDMQNLIIYWVTNRIEDPFNWIVDNLVDGTESIAELSDVQLRTIIRIIYSRELQYYSDIEELIDFINPPTYIQNKVHKLVS